MTGKLIKEILNKIKSSKCALSAIMSKLKMFCTFDCKFNRHINISPYYRCIFCFLVGKIRFKIETE